MRRITAFSSFLAILFACESNTPDNKELPEAKPVEIRLKAKVATDNSFALDLLKATCASSGETNVFISPLSVSMALSMTLNGAGGETAGQMKDALRASDYPMEQINEYSKSLMDALPEVDPSTQLTIANSIWYREGFSVKNDFLGVNRENYSAEIRPLDFSLPDAVKQINNWCALQTNGKIKEIIAPPLPGDALMYLINAVYFKGIWMSRFDKKNTREADFYPAGGAPLKVDMMRQEAGFNYRSDAQGEYLELPYGNNAFSMILLLPHEGKTTDDLLGHLDGDSWNEMVANMYNAEVNLQLPRFKAECKYEMQDGILPEMGMILPFTPAADFSGISETPLLISKVIHKTFVEVNEEGAEAAAATSVEMLIGSPGPVEIKPVDYIVNRPFLFAIRENSTGVILFIGKMGAVTAGK
ncbi:MAG: serpin family protein [Tannerella sp.]|jgi:serpin B|nr:serpin family protein [Tannerella sp.]